VEPYDDAYLPASQIEQIERPVVDVNSPNPHCRHWKELETFENVPTGQSVDLVAACGLNEPTGDVEQFCAADTANVPAVQNVQRLAPVFGATKPEAQS
jgi:hypothetical protein